MELDNFRKISIGFGIIIVLFMLLQLIKKMKFQKKILSMSKVNWKT